MDPYDLIAIFVSIVALLLAGRWAAARYRHHRAFMRRLRELSEGC